MSDSVLSRRALLIHQNREIALYSFALTAQELDQVAGISRVSRDHEDELIGYQRAEVKQHVASIVEYLDSVDPVFPNAIILALTSRCRFVKSRGPNADDGVASIGTIEIPIGGESRPAWIVDGQQRSLAMQRAVNRSFPVPVTAFVADTVEVQRDQFVRINSSRPLPPGLVTELLPRIATPINPRLAARRLPSALVDQLNSQEGSPFLGLIKRASMDKVSRSKAVVTDTSIVKALEESLNQPSSSLFPYRNMVTGETDVDGIWAVLLCYWGAVADTFPEAWGLPATRSRLMHGAGIRAMSRLMDRVMSGIDPLADGARKKAAIELGIVADDCAWTEGVWEQLGDMPWNQLQNTPRDIKLLSNMLIRTYVQRKAKT